MDAMQIANGLPMWIACAIPVAFVVLQAILFARGAYSAGKDIGLTEEQMNKAIKSSAVTAIGPSIVVLSGMLSLLVTVGGAIGWMRLSMIGSVMFESIAAGLGTAAVGVTLGTDKLTLEAFGMAVWTMILCSIGWCLFGTFAANRMDKIQYRLSKGNMGLMTTIASAAIIGVFSSMVANYVTRLIVALLKAAKPAAVAAAGKGALACLLGAAIMYVLLTVAAKKKLGWLQEWALAITIVVAMVITAVV